MNVLFPLGLLALLTLPIIILLHLRRERLRRVVVPSLILWQNLPQPLQGEKRRRLPLTFLLLLHLLAAALIALALSQPQLLQGAQDREQHLVLVIDTSTSMRAQAFLNETRFDQARSRARTMIQNMGDRDTIALIAAGPQARLLSAGGAESSASLITALEVLEAGGTGTDMAGALTLAQVALQNQMPDRPVEQGRIVVYSDLDQPQQTPLPEAQVNWERISSDSTNRGIIALSARPRSSQSNLSYDIYARVANYSNQQHTVSVRLVGFGTEEQILDTDSQVIGMNAESETELTWNVGGGVELVEVELVHDDALPDDNHASISLSQFRPLQSVLVTEQAEPATPSGMLERALRTIPDIALTVVTPADYANAPPQRSDLTIFNNSLPQSWPDGGVLVMNPPAATALLTVEASIATPDMRVVTPPLTRQADNPLADLNLESVNFNPVPVVQPPAWADVVLALENPAGRRIPLILRGRTGQSQIAVWAFDVNEINLTTRLVFPLLVAQTVRDLVPPPVPQSLTSGDTLTLQTDPRTDVVEFRPPDQETSQSIPVTNTLRLDSFLQTGVYEITERQGDTIIYSARIAVNAGSPLESDLRPRPMHTELALTPPATVDQAASNNPRDPGGQPLWPWLALAGLAIVVIEWLYIHR